MTTLRNTSAALDAGNQQHGNKPFTDQRVMSIAEALHSISQSQRTILFGSRARGDNRQDSDIDLLIVKDPKPTDLWLETLRQQARRLQKTHLPEASGIDIVCMNETEFVEGARLRNHLANTVAKEGIYIMPRDAPGHPTNYGDEQTDWADVETTINDANGAANWISAIRDAGIIEAGDDKQFGRVAHNALEFGYKAVLAANGCDYPTGSRDGHNLRILTDMLRENMIIPDHQLAPGEEHKYLTEFGGGAVYAQEHLPLDRYRIASDIPEAVAQLTDMVEQKRAR